MEETAFFDSQTGIEVSEANEIPPSVHPQETSLHLTDRRSYRSFLTSGIRKKIKFADTVYGLLDERDSKHRLQSFRTCRTNAWFVRHKVSGEIRVAAGRCNLRWCPLCIKTKRFIMRQSITPWVKSAKGTKFLTFTLKHSADSINDQIDKLYTSFQKIRRSKIWKKSVAGGLWFFQIKQSKTDELWHPHLHVIVDAKFMQQKTLSELWLSITDDSNIVDIRAVKDAKKAADYVSRYATAPCNLEDFTHEKAVEVVEALAGRRICGTFGTGKQIQLVPKKCPDADAWETLGSYFEVITNQGDNGRFDIIFLSWKLNQPDLNGVTLPPAPPPVEVAQVQEMPSTFKQAVFEWTEFYR